MKKFLHYLFAFVLIAAVTPGYAQDGRYSQYYNNPVYLNPALTGNGIEYIRLAGIYRTQWSGLGTPFITQGFAADKVVGRFGIGGFINNQGAGNAGINTLNIAGNLAYHCAIGKEKLYTVSAGVQVGMINKSFDPSKMTFDNQYDPDNGYDPNLGNGEVFATTSVTRPDINAGVFWQRGWGRDDIKFQPFAGMAWSHLNRPNETFIVDDNRAPIKSTFYAGAGYKVNDAVVITPSMMFLYQGTFKEHTFGTDLGYKLNSGNAIHFGVYNRMQDAVIAYAGYELNRVKLGMSYDANTSSLGKKAGGVNAFEISLAWSPLPKKKKAPKTPEPVVEEEIYNDFIDAIPVAEIPNTYYPGMEMTERKVVFVPVAVTTVPAEPARSNQPAVEAITPASATPLPVAVTVPDAVTAKKVETIVISIPEERPATPAIETTQPATVTAVPNATAIPETVAAPVVVETAVVIPEDHLISPEITLAPSATTPQVNSDNNVPDAIVTTTNVPEVAPMPEAAPEVDPVSTIETNTTVTVPVTSNVPKVIPVPATTIKADSDGDGITDDVDLCPYIKGTPATNGCPDSDHDGIQDLVDPCPMDAGAPGSNGCPDAAVTSAQVLVKKYNNVLFNPGSSLLNTPDIFDIIEQAIEQLYRDPATTVILSGHTDNEGGAATNMSLSEARTAAVKAYMVKMGVDPKRITTVAYGETMPLENNSGAEGRRLNRRVEINIVKQ